MERKERMPLLAAGGWPSIGLIYLFGVAASASLSKIIPILGDVGTHLGATPARFGLLISLMTVLPALLASVAGSIIDRLGSRSTLQLVALVGIGVNAAYLVVQSLAGFMAIRVVEGLLAVGAYAAAPALIMATAAASRRGRAMAVWSTYSPVGVSLGMALSGSFAGTAAWRGGYWLQLAMFGVLALVSPLLPRVAAGTGAARPAGLFTVWTQPGPLRISLAFAMLIMVGFGVTTIYPDWFAREHAVPVGHASNIFSIITLVMIPGGLVTGALLARGWRDGRLLTGIVLATIAVALPMFLPGIGEGPRVVAMVAWMLLQGAAIAVVMAGLPRGHQPDAGRRRGGPVEPAGSAGHLRHAAGLAAAAAGGQLAGLRGGDRGGRGCCLAALSASGRRRLSMMRALQGGPPWD
jgi:predicted MFS family arabinose efflux permease